MKSYWDNLTHRERLLVVMGISCTLFYLFYSLIYAPLSFAVKQRTKQFQEKQEILRWMQHVRPYAKMEKPLEPVSNTKLFTLVSSQLNKSPFQGFPYQLQQTEAGALQLSYENVPLNQFLSWLWQLHQDHAILIKQFNVIRTPKSGVVKLTLVIAAST